MSLFTSNWNLELPSRGEYIGTWDIPINSNIELIDSILESLYTCNKSTVQPSVNVKDGMLWFNGTSLFIKLSSGFKEIAKKEDVVLKSGGTINWNLYFNSVAKRINGSVDSGLLIENTGGRIDITSSDTIIAGVNIRKSDDDGKLLKQISADKAVALKIDKDTGKLYHLVDNGTESNITWTETPIYTGDSDGEGSGLNADLLDDAHLQEIIGFTIPGIYSETVQTGTFYWFIEKLPLTSLTSKDKLFIDLNINSLDPGSSFRDIVTLSNKGGFKFDWAKLGYSDGYRNKASIVAYQQGDGTTDIYLRTNEAYGTCKVFATYTSKMETSGKYKSTLQIGEPSVVVPAGTLIFDTKNEILYKPTYEINNTKFNYKGNQVLTSQNAGTLTTINATNSTNSDKVDNFHASQASTPNTIPVSDTDGKLNNNWIRQGQSSGLDADRLDGKHWVVVATGSVTRYGGQDALIYTGAGNKHLMIKAYSNNQLFNTFISYAPQQDLNYGCQRVFTYYSSTNTFVKAEFVGNTNTARTLYYEILSWE